MIERATVTAPEMIGLLVWWSVVLAAPVIVVRRWRRRRKAAVGRVREQVGQAAAEPRADRPAPAPPAAARSRIGASAESGLWVPRLPADALEPLCRFVDFQRRLELAASELRARLSQLPAGRWRIEPYPLTGERRNTLLVLGETGLFVISATYAPGSWNDVITVSTLARKVQALVPGYDGEVRPAICHPFSAMETRIWHRADEHGDWVGAWLVGGDSVLGWLLHFGSEQGLTPADLGRFDALTKPNWLRGAIPAAPTWPQLRDARSTHE